MNRKCQICGLDDKELIFALDFPKKDGNPLPPRNEIVYCKKCGFCFADNNASQDIYDAYYSKNNIYDMDAELKIQGYENPYEKASDFIERNVEHSKTILDIGCGDGSLLGKLKERGFEHLTGIDPSEQSVEVVKSKGIECIQGSAFNVIEDMRHSFDAVISSCVIEHIFDLNMYVESLKAYLKNGGVILLFAPAVEGFVEKVTDVANYFNQEHVNYFTMSSMDNLFNKHGMRRITADKNCLYKNTIAEMFFSIVYLYEEKSSVESDESLYSFDSSGRKLIGEYLRLEEEKRQDIDKRIIEFAEGCEIIIWGSGSYTSQLLVRQPTILKHVKYFVDNNKGYWGQTLFGRSIYPPEQIKREKDSNPILICSMNNSNSIIEQLGVMGIDNPYLSCTLLEKK